MKKIGLFGGAFNPFHNAHLAVANAALLKYNLDEVWLIPSKVHPFKGEMDEAPLKDRLKMIELAISNEKSLILKTDEIDNNLKYTYDTLCFFKSKNIDSEFYLIIGSDNLNDFHKWYRYKDILEMVKVIIYKRDPLERSIQNKIPNSLNMNHKLINISSTEIRLLISSKKDVKTMLPEKVFEYIQENKLYQ